MILYQGNIIETNLEEKYVEGLYDACLQTLNQSSPVTAKKVIDACDQLYQKVIAGNYDDVILPLLQANHISDEKFRSMARLFSKEELEYKCKIELGDNYPHLPSLKNGIHRELRPLGILFHIAAGNVDGLPAYSVIEGLLTGNINILKLPAGDNGLSVRLLSELIQFEPDLKDYIYVFDVPSTDTSTLKKFADIADGIVVWGGDEAVKAARKMADVTTKIIPWGHKLSFAYVTRQACEEDLYKLALHICETNQVFCSSCQGIYLDTENADELSQFSEKFYPLFQKANLEKGKTDMGMRGQNSIHIYTDQLEQKDMKIMKGDGISLCLKTDRELELSYLFRNVWIKALPHHLLIKTLKKHKNHLQTCGLLCSEDEKPLLADLLARAGIVRITGPDMSRTVAGEAHDGEYALQRYSRIVEID